MNNEPLPNHLNPLVSAAVASVINSAFETGLNPAWFQVDSLNRDGFLDAAFASGLGGKLDATASGKPLRVDWKLRGRLNEDGYKSPWREVTAEFAIAQWARMARGECSAEGTLGCMQEKAAAYLKYLRLLDRGEFAEADEVLFDEYEPDGIHDDALAQYVFADAVVFG